MAQRNSSDTSATMLVQITTNGQPKLHCPVCDKTMVSLSGYVKHVKKHEPPGGFLCRYCDGRFCSDEELKRHRNDEHTTIACRICKHLVFATEAEYREHIRDAHNGIDRELLRCDKCGAEYKTVEPFRRHQETLCGTVKPHVCNECGIAFVTKYNLKQHKESHTGELKFCCSYCGKNFLQKGRLVEHERSHTGEKPYKCDVCGKCFAHRESIVTHSSIHTGIRLVECRCCQSRFSCYSNLIKHRRTRPDTCGQPQFDPPKNRRRIHRSRIPATLNPTSEIKVSSQNKIIKPTEKEMLVKRKAPRQRRSKAAPPNENDNNNVTSPVEHVDSTPKRVTRLMNSLQMNNKNSKQSVDSFVYLIEPIENVEEERVQHVQHDVACDPIESKETIKTEVLAYEFSGTLEEPPSESIKREVTENSIVFNEEVKLLNGFFCDDDGDAFSIGSGCAKSVPDRQDEGSTTDSRDILQETEVILINNAECPDVANEPDEEDVLNIPDNPQSELINCAELFKNAPLGMPAESPEHTHEEDQCPSPNATTQIGEDGAGDELAEDDGATMKTKPNYKELKAQMQMLKKKQKQWLCPYCIKIYILKKPFERHLRGDHNLFDADVKKILGESNPVKGFFNCPICDKTYYMEKRLKSHIALHGPDGRLVHKCPCYCNLFFASKFEATAHAHAEHRDLLYCEICEKFLTSHDSLKTHRKFCHAADGGGAGAELQRNAPRNFVCDKCGKKFLGRTSLNDHVRSDCGRLPLYQCNVCGKYLTTAGILKTHLLLHKDETPFQCDKCNKTFKVKAQYKTHIKTRHTDNKPFKCHLCPKAYPYRESLLTHMSVHTGIKRFLCIGCGKRFTCISNLQAHRKVQAETCGQLPLNAKATQYMGVQKGYLLMGAKPEAGLEYTQTNTLLAKEVIDRNRPMAEELNFPSKPTVPLHYTSRDELPLVGVLNLPDGPLLASSSSGGFL